MAKVSKVLIRLVSSEDSGSFYVRKKNPRKMVNKLEFRKYDPKLRKHVVFKEKKDQVIEEKVGRAVYSGRLGISVGGEE